jgi:hypothetical protein
VGNIKITGLPAIVSRRNRITLDSKLCSYFGIPNDGLVRAQINSDSILIYPENLVKPQTIVKQVSIRRFNLPTSWAEKNGVVIGQYAYLIAADAGIQIRIKPWSAEQCRQYDVCGIPIKITHMHVYIPKSIWGLYGIEADYGLIVQETQGSRIIMRKYTPICQRMPVQVRHRCIPISPEWLSLNGLMDDASIWLYGINGGIVLSVRPACNEDFNDF